MIRSTTEQTIARSAEDIWTYAADTLRHPEWMSVTDARIVRGHGGEVGARGREHLAFGPFRWDAEFEVVEAVPGRRIVWRAVAGVPFQADLALDLVSLGPTSTRATYRLAFQMRGLWRLLTPLVAMDSKAGPARELRRLKENIEAAVTMAPATS